MYHIRNDEDNKKFKIPFINRGKEIVSEKLKYLLKS